MERKAGALQFGSFRFAETPQSIRQVVTRKVVSHLVLEQGTQLEDTGYCTRQIVVEGTMTGTDAATKIEELEDTMEQGSQCLFGCGVSPCMAQLVEIQTTPQKGSNAICYTCTFAIEAKEAPEALPLCTVAEEDTNLVALARRWRKNLDALAEKNRHLVWPLQVQKGSVVWL